jgi:hypothetical protein
MSRRKGEQTARMNERDFPHLVEIPLPPGGLGNLEGAIAAFHDERKISMRFGLSRREDGEFCVRLCFSDSTDADAFQERFGGTRLEREVNEKDAPRLARPP